MLREPTLGLARGVEPLDGLATDVHDFAVGIGPQARECVVQDRGRPGRIERRLLDLVERRRLLEVSVGARRHEGIVAADGLLQDRARHRPLLVGALDLAGELRERVGAEEETIRIDVRGHGLPFLARRAVGVEDRPDRAAAVELGLVAMPGHAGGEEVVGAVDLVPEPLAILVDEDEVLPILDRQAGRACLLEHRAVGLVDERAIPPAAADVARLGDGGAAVTGLAGGCPQRGAELHGGELAVGALMHPRLAGLLILLGQPRIEHAAEVHVAGMAAGGDDDSLVGLDVHGVAAVHRRNADHAATVRLLADDLRHLVAQEDLRAFLARADFEPADQA